MIGIPDKIQLCGLTIQTVLDKTFAEKTGCQGKTDYFTQEIHLDPDVTHPATTEQAYIHELLHWVLYVMNEHKLRKDEKFVDVLAHLLYQALDSGGYKIESKPDQRSKQSGLIHRTDDSAE